MQRRLYSLDYLKIGSAFVILYFHSLGWQQTSFKSAYIDSLVSNGAVVMVLFFMLSGFCLFYNYGEKDYTTLANVTAFYKKRIAGVYPAYLIHIIALAFITSLSVKQALLIFPLFLAGMQMSLASSIGLSINGTVWFMSCLFMAYALFPYMVILVKRASVKCKVAAILVLYSICAFGGVCQIPLGLNYSDAYYSPIIRICEFSIGVLLGDFFATFHHEFSPSNKMPKYVASLLHYGGIVICIVTLFWLQLAGKLSFWSADYGSIPLFSILILQFACVPENGILNRIAATRPIRFLSELTFTIYLCQVIPLRYYGEIMSFAPSLAPGGYRKLLAITVITLLIAIPYSLITRCLKKWLTRVWIAPQMMASKCE